MKFVANYVQVLKLTFTVDSVEKGTVNNKATDILYAPINSTYKLDGDGVSIVEWANLIEDILPDRYTNILIEKDLSKGFDYRRITIDER